MVIVVQAWIYSGQLEQMKKSTDASTDSANAAKDALVFGHENARLDQRAWVTTWDVSGVPVVGTPLKVAVRFKNSGKTPAYNASVHFFLEVAPKDTTPNFEAEENEAMFEGNPDRILISPNGERTSIVLFRAYDPEALSDTDFNGIKHGDIVAFVHGRIDYDDVFHCSHWTTFCYVFDPQTAVWHGCEHHNEADENKCP
ncbi:MAG TPA: hypothetical protein VEP30_00135 [Chthoniobacterales bacterium]|nr:hypothetical protein [Chthoniobacterales bacterium]